MIYYTQNNIGSTTLLTDKNGSDVGQFLYSPFGEMWVQEASSVDISNITRFFTNQQYDKESGLYYYNARYYDPHLGSFITPDPAMANLNHYAYCNSNPIKYTDPTGLTTNSYENPYEDDDPDDIKTQNENLESSMAEMDEYRSRSNNNNESNISNNTNSDSVLSWLNDPTIRNEINNPLDIKPKDQFGFNDIDNIKPSNLDIFSLNPDKERERLVASVNNYTYSVLGALEVVAGIGVVFFGVSMMGVEGASTGQVLTGATITLGGFYAAADGITAIIKGLVRQSGGEMDDTLSDCMRNAGAILIYNLTGNYIDSDSFNSLIDMNQHISDGASFLAGKYYDANKWLEGKIDDFFKFKK